MNLRTSLVAFIMICMIACGGGSDSGGGNVKASPSLSISMSNQILKPGESQPIEIISNETSPILSWTASGGDVSNISNSYIYTSPATPGMYTLQAKLQDHPSVTSEITVCVVSVTVKTVGNVFDSPGSDLGPGSGEYFSVNRLPDGRFALTNFNSPGLIIWDPFTGTCSYATHCPIRAQFPDVISLINGSLLQVAGGGLIEVPDPHTIYQFDIALDTWSAVGSTTYLRYLDRMTIMRDGRLLITGGETGAVSQNPTMELWDPQTGGPSSVFAYMQTPRSAHSATLLPDGSVLIAGGGFGLGTLKSTEFVTSSLASIAGPDMSVERYKHSAISLQDGRVLMVGGESPVVEAFVPSSNSFQTIGRLNPAVVGAPAVSALSNGWVFIAGGYLGDLSISTAVQIFIPEIGKLRTIGDIPIPIYGAKAITGQDGNIYILGGYDASSRPRTEVIQISIQ